MTGKEFVLSVYPNAFVHQYKYRGYYTTTGVSRTIYRYKIDARWSSLSGFYIRERSTIQAAWNEATKVIRKAVLYRLES